MRRRGFPLLIALGLLAGASGCRSVADRVRAQAARDFDCPEEKVTTDAVSAWLMRATGCGTEALYNRWADTPLARAVFDLNCPKEQVKMFALGDGALGVEGCGKRVSYAWVHGAWIASAAPTP